MGDGQPSTYTLLANGNETKPFDSYKKTKEFALVWKGKFSVFEEIVMHKDGKFLELVEFEN